MTSRHTAPLPHPISIGELLTPLVSPATAGMLGGERGLLPQQRQGGYLIPMLCCRSWPAPGTQDAVTARMEVLQAAPLGAGQVMDVGTGSCSGRGTWG